MPIDAPPGLRLSPCLCLRLWAASPKRPTSLEATSSAPPCLDAWGKLNYKKNLYAQ